MVVCIDVGPKSTCMPFCLDMSMHLCKSIVTQLGASTRGVHAGRPLSVLLAINATSISTYTSQKLGEGAGRGFRMSSRAPKFDSHLSTFSYIPAIPSSFKELD